jgi:D-tyrosyl-tRNA(Tyr) deacylase
MKVLLQRVTEASVSIDGKEYCSIQKGLLLLVGLTHSDTTDICDKIAKKIVELRIFEDELGKMNLSLLDVEGEILSVSQFTLYADYKKGRRPGFEKAAKPDYSKPLYEYFNTQLKQYNPIVETGIFGSDMKISLVNDGPVSIMIDSEEL